MKLNWVNKTSKSTIGMDSILMINNDPTPYMISYDPIFGRCIISKNGFKINEFYDMNQSKKWCEREFKLNLI